MHVGHAEGPLGVSDGGHELPHLDRIQASFGVSVDRESLVSSLSKKIARGDRFLRTAKNTFTVRER